MKLTEKCHEIVFNFPLKIIKPDKEIIFLGDPTKIKDIVMNFKIIYTNNC